MILPDVADEIAAAAATIAGLRVHSRVGTAITAPALVVGYPSTVDFDSSYGRGADRITLPLFVLVGRASDRAGAGALLAYLSGEGTASVKAAVEAGTYTACDVVHVDSASVGAIVHEGVEYLGATFTTTIIGRGAA